MNIKVPIERKNVGKLLLACFFTLIHGRSKLEFNFSEEQLVLSEGILLTKAEVEAVRVKNREAHERAALMAEAIDEGLEVLDSVEDPLVRSVAQELRSAIEVADAAQRTIH